MLVDTRLRRWAEVLAGFGDQTVVLGHTHMPFVRPAYRRLIVNPGGVGMPYGRGGDGAGAHPADRRGGSRGGLRTPRGPAVGRATTARWCPVGGLMILSCTDLELTLPYRSHQRSTGAGQDR